MDRRVTPPKRVTSTAWDPQHLQVNRSLVPALKQALSLKNSPLTTSFGKMLYRENMESHLRKLKVS